MTRVYVIATVSYSQISYTLTDRPSFSKSESLSKATIVPSSLRLGLKLSRLLCEAEVTRVYVIATVSYSHTSNCLDAMPWPRKSESL